LDKPLISKSSLPPPSFTTSAPVVSWMKNWSWPNDPETLVRGMTLRLGAGQALAEDIKDPRRIIPYIQLHEFEAILFSGPAWFRYSYEHDDAAIAELQTITNRYTTPELIDDDPHAAPSKRIIAQIPADEAAKAAVGPEVAASIGLETIRAKCPHFRAWLSRLEKLGT
jgi:hypothetical protein